MEKEKPNERDRKKKEDMEREEGREERKSVWKNVSVGEREGVLKIGRRVGEREKTRKGICESKVGGEREKSKKKRWPMKEGMNENSKRKKMMEKEK